MGQCHHSPYNSVNKSVTHFCSVGVEKSFVEHKWRSIVNVVWVKSSRKFWHILLHQTLFIIH